MPKPLSSFRLHEPTLLESLRFKISPCFEPTVLKRRGQLAQNGLGRPFYGDSLFAAEAEGHVVQAGFFFDRKPPVGARYLAITEKSGSSCYRALPARL